MPTQDLFYVLQWWATIFIIGLVFFPLSSLIFNKFVDYGYIFSKVIGIVFLSYLLFLLNTLHILPFSLLSISIVAWIFILINVFILKKDFKKFKKIKLKLLVFEEILFLIGIIIWAYVRAHEPSINGLEKFMDFGFVNSILRGDFLPAKDMWLASMPINYYYFGHFATAILTKLSFLPSYITYNLMLATLFSFTFCLSFSLGINLISKEILTRKSFFAGVLSGAIISFGGNLHMLYGLFKTYNVDNPVPIWKLQFLPSSFPNAYWYPNATRFIPFTIHEFPIYSFVVSDLHGHVLDIPLVLTTLAITYTLLLEDTKKSNVLKFLNRFNVSYFGLRIILISLMLASMYMTNAWDGAIYLMFLGIILLFKNRNLLRSINYSHIKNLLVATLKPFIIAFALFIIFTLPFSVYFKPFASGVGVLCAPTFLTKIGHVGPLLFEAAHCQKSPWWQLLTLYGFFYFFVVSFFVFIAAQRKKIKLLQEDFFVIALIIVATILIIVPEFVYLKDIYPQHYRANTMFKLVYQSFMLLSLASAYVIVRIISFSKKTTFSKVANVLFYLATFALLLTIFTYPFYAINSYYGDLKTYKGLDGIAYLKTKYPDDYEAINWLNQNVVGQPVALEAQGDSYTDYERISANTGLPTILGWTVHEWLWHGTYDVPAPRIEEVKMVYENPDITLTKNVLKKYKVQYVIVGNLEREKYPNLDESKFGKLGNMVFQQGSIKIYKVN